jgi:hypothetical protein
MYIHVHGLVKDQIGITKSGEVVKAKAEKGCFTALIEKVQNLFRSFLALFGKRPDLGKRAEETANKIEHGFTKLDQDHANLGGQFAKLQAENAKIREALAEALKRFS